jgi:histone deacetylase complex regulatory component SIN3
VQELFVDEPDLAEGFEQFLPESSPKEGGEVLVGKGTGGGGEGGEGEAVKGEGL